MSDIKFSCPKCEGHLIIDERGVGLEVTCNHCGTRIIVPNLTTLSASATQTTKRVMLDPLPASRQRQIEAALLQLSSQDPSQWYKRIGKKWGPMGPTESPVSENCSDPQEVFLALSKRGKYMEEFNTYLEQKDIGGYNLGQDPAGRTLIGSLAKQGIKHADGIKIEVSDNAVVLEKWCITDGCTIFLQERHLVVKAETGEYTCWLAWVC